MKGLIVFVTASNRKEADKIVRTLVKENLAACVSVIAGVSSCYRWQGRIEHAKEILLMIKTTARRYPALERRILSLHSYTVPEILATPVAAGNPAYLRWLEESV